MLFRSAGEIGGNVFHDYNNSGTLDSLEIGLAGIAVKVFDCNGKLLGTTTTDKFGNYSFAGMPADKVRIEFGTLPTPYISTKAGADNGTTTQFVTAPNCSVDLGINDPTDYCQQNPLGHLFLNPLNNLERLRTELSFHYQPLL